MTDRRPRPAITIIAIMWIVLGGMQLLSGIWAVVVSVLMGVMSLSPQVGPAPPGFRVFMVAAPFAALVQCTLAALCLYSAVRLLQARAGAAELLRVLSWLMIGFTWACGLGMAAVVVAVPIPEESALITRGIMLAMCIGIATFLSIPPFVTVKVLGSQASREHAPDAGEVG